MRKILLLSEIFPPTHGGSGRWFYELYKRLVDIDITVMTNLSSQDRPTFPHKIIDTQLSSNEWGVFSLNGLRFYFSKIKETLHYCKVNKITQIQAGRVLHEGLIATVVSRILNIELVIFVHGEDIQTTKLSREHDLLSKFVFNSASTVVCNSHNSANLLKTLDYDRCEDIIVLHPGADMSLFVPKAHNSVLPSKYRFSDQRILLTVGRLQARKGQDMMIQALPKLLKEIPNLHYVIVGNGDDLPRLQNLIQQNKLEAYISIFAEASDAEMLLLYQHCDLFILPNRTIGGDIEGFGMVLVEAQACAKPVVAGDSGGTKETLKPGETGFVIDCTNPDVLAQHLLPILNDKDLFGMGQNAQKFVREAFCWDKHAMEFANKVIRKGLE